MTVRLSTLIVFFIALPAFSIARDKDETVLLTVSGRKVEAGEFIRMYKKSQVPGKSISVDDYLQKFILFKLKVADATNEGYDTTASFRDELGGYRNKLAQSYLTDNEAKEEFLRKAYQRYLLEINTWHIMVGLPHNPSPADTAKALEKAVAIRARILKGESFDSVAKSSSDDKSVVFNRGNLGYITAFQMIKPFEDAVYALKPGIISSPVRTPYGYHIIKVTDIRPSRGKVLVAHIMKNAPPGCSVATEKKAEEEINEIYNKLNTGIPFSELAQKYSDHKESASKGGILNWFGAGEMIPEFVEAAFAIADTGQYTKPFRTIYGWHIIRLLKKQPAGTFEETVPWLESKLKKYDIEALCRKAFTDKLKKEYNFRVNAKSMNWFILHADSSVIRGKKKFLMNEVPDGWIFTFNRDRMKNTEFAGFINNQGSLYSISDPSLFVKSLLETATAEKLTSYENSNLEKKYPEFRYLMNEFHDGILLFNISDKKIWQKANSDTAGLHMYYRENINRFMSDREIQAVIFTLRKKEGRNELDSAIGRFSGSGDLKKELSVRFNTGKDTLMFISEGSWKKGENAEIDAISWSTGMHTTTVNGFPSIILVKKVTEALPLRFENVAEKVMAGYQEMLENEWSIQLKQKYIVWTDRDVLAWIKKRLENE